MNQSLPTASAVLLHRGAEPAAERSAARIRPVRRQPRPGWGAVDFRELWRYREMLVFQTVREFKIRYRQTFLGAAWAILQPVLTMIVFTIFFGRLAGLPSDGIAYPVFILAATIPWQLFASGLTQAGNSLVDNSQALTKVYFPRLILPMASVAVALVDFAIAIGVLAGLMGFYGVAPSWEIVALPLFLLLAMTTALGAGLWLSALNVLYRDVRYLIPFLVQIWLFTTPVAYASSLVPAGWQFVYGLNPMVGVIDGSRWALLGTAPPDAAIAGSACVAALMLASGLFFFRRLEHTFADVI